MTIIRISQYKSGVEEYLEHGRKKGRALHRDQLDQRVPILGSFHEFKFTNQYVQKKKKWVDNYWHITISLPFKYHNIPQGVHREITNEVLDFYFHLYDRKQLSAYAEIHYPKQQTIIDSKTGESKQRLPHVHLVVSKLDLWTGTQLRILPYKLEVARAFQIWLDDNHRFESHYFNKKDDYADEQLPTAAEAELIVDNYKLWHRQYNQPNMSKQLYAPKQVLKKSKWLTYVDGDKKSKKQDEVDYSKQAFQNWQQVMNQEFTQQTDYSSVQAIKQRLIDMQLIIDNKLLIEKINKQLELKNILSEAAREFALDRESFEIVEFNKRPLVQDQRTGLTYSPVGLAHDYLHMNINQSLKWLQNIAPEISFDDRVSKDDVFEKLGM